MGEPKQQAATLRFIEDSCTYPLAVFMKYVGWGRHAVTQARQRGLVVVKVSGRCFVRGKDFSRFIGEMAEKANHAKHAIRD